MRCTLKLAAIYTPAGAVRVRHCDLLAVRRTSTSIPVEPRALWLSLAGRF